MTALIILLLILAVLLIIFTVQNATVLTVHFLFWEFPDAPLAFILMGCIILGYLVGLIFFYPRIWRVKRENKQLTKLNKELQTRQLKTEPKSPSNVATPVDKHEGLEMSDE
ncbi:MAG: hypothetical protein CR996_01500 [Draconibacterium sp.]|nr:MAG: hypothetical protein CR996_01500 [Draconibacterium sp.]